MLASCSSMYKNLQPATGDLNYIQKFKPNFNSALYKAEIDVVGRHLSGLLLIKTMPDSSIRIVLSNEIGFKFFDFEFKQNGDFNALFVVKQMDKKPVIKTLKKDFELILLPQEDTRKAYLLKDGYSLYYIFPKQKGSFCYITDLGGSEIKTMEISSPNKPIVQAIMKNYTNGVPDTIGITHTTFNLTIGLKKIKR
jgi:hypothetical protein